jgi:hypothetical protein
MPTKPNDDFIPRNIENPKIQEILNQYSSALEEVVNFASHVAKWSAEKIHGGEELAPLYLSFRHIFELIDAISVLVKYSCIEPCKNLLRSVFESVLAIKYIMEKDTDIRGTDFMTCCWHHEINELRKEDPDDCMHKQLLAIIQKTDSMKDKQLPETRNVKELKERIKVLRDHLNSSEYVESEKEYQRFKKTTGRKPDWYSMHGGPSNLEGLAQHLGVPLEYELYYREWSGLVHGFDIIMDNIEVAGYDQALLSQIRLPANAFDVTQKAMNFGLEIIPRFVDYFVPEKVNTAKDWYSKEVEPLKRGVLLKNRIIVK